MKHFFIFSLCLCWVNSYFATVTAQSLVANSDTAYLYTEYQPVLILPLDNDGLPDTISQYVVDVRIIDEPIQGLATFISSELDLDWTLLYIPFGGFGVSDSLTYRIFLYDEFGNAVDSSNVASVKILRDELPSDDCLSDCVYPGDTNLDGTVDANDLLFIGIAYGFSGTPRLEEEQGTDWQPHAANDWTAELGGINFKHFDCNGDGTVDDFDQEAIILNYGMQNNSEFMYDMTTSIPADTASLDIHLSIANTTPIQIGDVVEADIILGNPTELVSVYGLAFSIMYNAEDGGTGQVEFTSSFINEDTNAIFISKNKGGGRVDAALSRTNHLQTQGNGSIARVSFVMENFLEGKQLSDMLTLTIDKFSLLAGDGTFFSPPIGMPYTSASIEVVLDDNPPLPNQDAISLFPIPANNYLYLSWLNKEELKSVMIYDTKGALSYRQTTINLQNNTLSIPVTSLSEGIYIAVMRTASRAYTQRIIVNH